MNLYKLVIVVLATSFLLGVAVSTLAPTPTMARDIDPCDTSCYIEYQGGPGNCPYGQVENWRCYQAAMLADCAGPFNCRCVMIGCADPR